MARIEKMADCHGVNELIRRFGQKKVLFIALRTVKPERIGKYGKKFYDLRKIEARMREYALLTQQEDRQGTAPLCHGERWRPDHPGRWTEEDIAEFNRRHPFRRECVVAFVAAVTEMAGGRR